jgi:hypothetical protein
MARKAIDPWLRRERRREAAPGRALTCVQTIRARARRKRLAPRKAARYPRGMKHAWQRKAGAST